VRLPTLGLGVSGPHGTALVPAGATAALVAEALDLGVATFDTGPSYGAGEAERRLGAALRGRRERAFLMTKAGVTDAGFGRRQRDFSPTAVRASVEASLRRLDVAQVDLLWLHGPAPAELSPALFAAIEATGAARAIGLVGRGDEIDRGLERYPFSAVMTPVGAHLDARQRDRLADLAARNVALYGIEAFAAAAPDRRAARSPADLWYAARGLARPRPSLLKPQTAFSAALATPGLACLIFTTTRAAHLRANVAQARALDPAGGAS
jgi:aryl-alcohol dehydrogenase-like predicted oxidoreductase